MPLGCLLLPLAIIATLAVAGCGSSGGEESGPEATATATTPAAPPGASARGCEGAVAGTGRVRVTGVGCDVARGVVAAWMGKPSCSSLSGASRFSCAVHGDYRCLGAVGGRGVAVSCSRPGSSVAFVARRG